jgi:CheY-like chemotaxis protein
MKKILLVEDDPMSRELVAEMLRDGFELIEAATGKEAIAAAIMSRPDLILMDLSLPDMDGWEATRILKDAEETRVIPVIAVTAHAMYGDREKAVAAGCDDFVTKPISPANLREKISRFLGK